MFYFRGNIDTTASSTALSLPSVIKSFSLVNKTGGMLTVNVYVTYGGDNISIMPYNYQLDAAEMYEGTREILLVQDEQIVVETDGEIDFDFTLDNTTAP